MEHHIIAIRHVKRQDQSHALDPGSVAELERTIGVIKAYLTAIGCDDPLIASSHDPAAYKTAWLVAEGLGQQAAQVERTSYLAESPGRNGLPAILYWLERQVADRAVVIAITHCEVMHNLPLYILSNRLSRGIDWRRIKNCSGWIYFAEPVVGWIKFFTPDGIDHLAN